MKLKSAILTAIVMMLYASIAFCQNKKIDSLQNILKNAKEDTNKANTLCELSIQAIGIYDEKLAMQAANEALLFAQKIKYRKGEANAYDNMGNVYHMQGDYERSREKHLFALAIRQEINDEKGVVRSYINIGRTYLFNDNYPIAGNYFFLALKKAEIIKDTVYILDALQELSIVYGEQEDYENQKKFQEKGLDYASNTASLTVIAEINAGLCRVYLATGEPEKVYPHASDALDYYLSQSKKYYEMSGWIIQQVAKADEQLGNRCLLEQDIVKAKKNYEASLFHFKEAGKYFEEVTDSSTYSLGTLSDFYADFGAFLTRRGKLEQAEKYLNKSLIISKKLDWMDNLKTSYKSFYELDSAKRDYKNAFKNYRSYIFYRDSLTNKKNIARVEGSRMQYEFDKKEDSLKQKQIIADAKLQSQKKQRYFYWAGLAMLGLLSFFVFLNFRNQKKINRLADDAHARQKAELELQSLRAQLNPHFMFNSLNAIQELILLEENEKSQSYLARFAKLLRMLLENAERPFIPLQREIDFLQLYLSLENLRIPDLQHSISVDPAIDTEQIQIPNMILQPYIENAIWHGLSHKGKDKQLRIRITQSNGVTQYAIEDNGVGRKRSAELKSLYRKEHKSKGMELLSKRFKLLAKEYRSDIETKIADVINNDIVTGTRVTIAVPKILK